MPTILVTGHQGFIGHNVIKQLMNRTSYDLIGIDNQNLYTSLDATAMTPLFNGRIAATNIRPFKSNSINILDNLTGIGSPDIVIHTASYPRQHEVALDPLGAQATMIEGLRNVIESFKHCCKRFVFISSSMVYGNFMSGVTESHDLKPTNQYGIFKKEGEKITRNLCRQYGIEYVIIRPSAVYGELDVNNRLVGKFLHQAMNGETLVVKGPWEEIDLTYVDDAVDGIIRAALIKSARNQVFNITRSAPEPTTILQAAEIAIQQCGQGSIFIADRDPVFPKRGTLSIIKAKEFLGYRPTIDIPEGFKRYHASII